MNRLELNYKKVVQILLTCILIFTSCSRTDDSGSLSTPEYFFTEPYLVWGTPKEQIASLMGDYELISDTEMELCYNLEEKGETIAYGFKHGKLCTAVVIPAKTLSVDKILLALNGYEKLSKYEENVYINRDKNTVAEIYGSTGLYAISWSQYGLDVAKAVDLGLSVKWADVNYNGYYDDGAAIMPDDHIYGMESVFSSLIGWGDPTGVKQTEGATNYPVVYSISGTLYDVAKQQWGGGWRIPTKEEFKELLTACVWQWTDRGKRSGYTVTGPNGNSIFLPISGYRRGEYHWYEKEIGYYWTGTSWHQIRPETSFISPAVLIFDKNKKGINASGGSWALAYPYSDVGCSIRPVLDY